MNPFSLQYLTHLPASPADLQPASVHPTILALHGRGSNERDLIGLASYLPQKFLWISPRGPFTLGPDSYEWFQITQIGKPDPIRLANALTTLDTFIDEIIANYPVDKNKLYLLGSSQGSIMSMSYTLTKLNRSVLQESLHNQATFHSNRDYRSMKRGSKINLSSSHTAFKTPCSPWTGRAAAVTYYESSK